MHITIRMASIGQHNVNFKNKDYMNGQHRAMVGVVLRVHEATPPFVYLTQFLLCLPACPYRCTCVTCVLCVRTR